MNHLSEEELRSLAAQLRKPEGEFGKIVGNNMQESNHVMIHKAIDSLRLESKDVVLEIGHGNGFHIPYFFETEANMRYYGIELSELMQAESLLRNQLFVNDNKASFHVYNGIKFPFPSDFFTKIVSVNTLYFWENPISFFREIERVLQKGGLFSLCFADKSFLKQMPFSCYGFTLYSKDEVVKLTDKTELSFTNTTTFTDVIITKSGEQLKREFHVLTFTK